MSALTTHPPALASLADVLVRAHAENPTGVAVCEPGREVTYEQLDGIVATLAGALSELGVGAGQRVAIWLPKSIEAVAAMQAALRVGAAYIPVDPLSPAERVRRVLTDSRSAACVALAQGAAEALSHELADIAWLTTPLLGDDWRLREGRPPRRAKRTTQLGSTGPGGVGGVPVSDDGSSGPIALAPRGRVHSSEPGRAIERPTAGEEIAYILYTSGSTGTPKGVCISHRNALSFIEWAYAEIGPCGGDRFANHAPLHFDLSVLDIYVAFLAGATVCLIPESMSFIPTRLVDFIDRECISIWYSVPTALTLMLRAGLSDAPPRELHTVLFAGEPFPIESLRSLRRALPTARLLNLYGPTETNVCTYYEVGELGDDVDRPVPIGRACSGDRVWAEGAAGRRSRVGERGELVVEGPTVMLGYWGKPRHTGPYRTGDIVERISEFSYRYVGRRDAMVKVRGNRVELGEVEAAIAGHPDVSEVAVAVLGTGPESRLAAAIVSRGDAVPGLLDVKRWCAERLPRYMIVHETHIVEALPRSRNGKLDRRALDAQLQEAHER